MNKGGIDMGRVKKTTKELVDPILKEHGLELFDIEYVKEGKDWFLRVYIDKEEGVNIDECEQVSQALGERLDTEDVLERTYRLEVPPPGVQRAFTAQERRPNRIDRNIRVTRYVHFARENQCEGLLNDF